MKSEKALQKVIKEFLYIFGTQTTTNHDLMRYAKMLKIKNFHIVMSDEVKELPENNFSAILNFQLSSEKGSHWVSLYKHNSERLYYFDSYGTPVQKQVIEKFLQGKNKHSHKTASSSERLTPKAIRTHDYKIQPLASSMCGQLSLLVIYLLSNGFKYEDIVNSLKNDIKLYIN